MPIVVNSNTSATVASYNLSKANDALRKSLNRLSSGNRINAPGDDAGGLAVAYKLDSQASRTTRLIQNAQNALSYLEVQDSALSSVGSMLDRIAELRTMAQDLTKNTGDIENYSKEFIELQTQLSQIREEKFNGISLFSIETSETSLVGMSNATLSLGSASHENTSDGSLMTYDKFSRTLLTNPSGVQSNGSISINVVNLQFVLSIGALTSNTGTTANLGGFGISSAADGLIEQNGQYVISDILDVSVSQLTDAIERLADMRAENGAEQNRVANAIDLMRNNLASIEAAHGRIADTDVALESTRFAKENILVQASASMTAQANQLSNIALTLIG